MPLDRVAELAGVIVVRDGNGRFDLRDQELALLVELLLDRLFELAREAADQGEDFRLTVESVLTHWPRHTRP